MFVALLTAAMTALLMFLAYAIGFGFVLLVFDYCRILLLRRKLPPGPLPIPLFGNTLIFPDEKPWMLIEQLSKQYKSPIVTFWVGRQPTIYLNDCWTAHELLNKRASNYASRPRQVVLGELLGALNNIATMYYGDQWRLHRRLTHSVVGKQRVQSYRHIQNAESKVTALRLLESSKDYVAHLERSATSVMSIIGTGKRITKLHDPLTVKVIKVTAETGEKVVPGKHFPMILETFPWMASLPSIKKMFAFASPEHNMYYRMAKEASERRQDCYFSYIYESQGRYELSHDEVTSLTGNLFGAGVETSTYTMLSFLLAACCFPEAMSEARAEIDAVCGSGRSPTSEDTVGMRHVQAVMKEVFRWRAPAVLGGQPHAPLEDDLFDGYWIPKGTSVTGNLWAIHRNERDFPEPDRFCPERHFVDHNLYRPLPMEKRHMAFGWGRRVCAGAELAEQGVLTQIARFLWAFHIESEIDERTGKPEVLDIFNYTSGFNIRPKPFRCRFTPRSPEIWQSIIREGREAEIELHRHELQ